MHMAKLTAVRQVATQLCSSWRTIARVAEEFSSAGGNLGLVSERVRRHSKLMLFVLKMEEAG